MFNIAVKVSPAEIESVYRHVHHATTLHFLEKARLAYLESLGYPSEWFIARNTFPVVASISVKYKREIFEEDLKVSCENPEMRGKILVLEQRVFNSNLKEAVTARVDCAFMQGSTKRAIIPPEEFVAKIRAASNL